MASKVSKRKTVSYDKYGYYFVIPFIAAFLIFQLYPIIYTINLSFTGLAGWDTTYEYIQLDNYISLMNNKLFWNALKNTVIIWGMNFVPQMGISLLLASWFTSVKVKVRGRGAYKVLFYFPGIITAASVAILFRALESYPTGPINSILLNFGILSAPFEFLQSEMAARASVAFMQFWMYYGGTMIMLIAGILAIDTSLYEAAMIDGATDKKIFTKITLPLIKPIMLYVLVTSLIGGFQIFDIPFLFTGGGPDNSTMTIAMYIYYQAFTGGRNFGIAAAAAVILLIIIATLSACLFRFFQDDN